MPLHADTAKIMIVAYQSENYKLLTENLIRNKITNKSNEK